MPCSLEMGPTQQTGRTGSGLLPNLPPYSASPLTSCFSVSQGGFGRRVAELLHHQIKVPPENSGEHHEGYIHTQLETPKQHQSAAPIYLLPPLFCMALQQIMCDSRLFRGSWGQGCSCEKPRSHPPSVCWVGSRNLCFQSHRWAWPRQTHCE